MSTDTNAIILSPTFGYGDDLMYFGEIFRAVKSKGITLKIPVRVGFPIDRYTDLDLDPALNFTSIRRSRRNNVSSYEVTFFIPSLSTIKYLYSANYDLLVTIEFTPLAIIGIIIARLRKKKVLLCQECNPEFRLARGGVLVRIVKRLISKLANRVITCNRFGYLYLRDKLGIPPDKIIVSPYLTSGPVVLDSKFDNSPRIKRDSHRLNIIFINTFSARKGVFELCTAVAALPQSIRNELLIHMVGSGPDENELKRRVNEGGISTTFAFYDRVSHSVATNMYRDADACILPTLADYRSLGGFEALNAGIPVIASQYDGASEECAGEGRGWVIDPTNRDELCSLLTTLICDRSHIENAKKCIAQSDRLYSYDSIARNLVDAMKICAS